ncbi:hypothetical protein TNCV_1542831 [Trichonephila clavipes]|nr:hypothetical protein TNCV_1542831 [Trichonephila clavipes]
MKCFLKWKLAEDVVIVYVSRCGRLFLFRTVAQDEFTDRQKKITQTKYLNILTKLIIRCGRSEHGYRIMEDSKFQLSSTNS